jgi:hypothetical protein
MAIGWVSLLKTVPWADVISTAPVVADGARKLWKAATNKPPAEVTVPDEAGSPASDSERIAKLQIQLASVEASATELHQQMLASSELIKALADQNTELVRRAEANRVRLQWLSVAVVIALVSSVTGLLAAVFR